MTVPRPTRSFGRPGTSVVPPNFERDHAPVFETTRTARCRIHGPTDGVPVLNPDLGYSVAPAAPLLYEGTVRLIPLTAADRNTLVGDQDQHLASYRAAIAHDAARIPNGSTLVVTETNDTWLGARTLFVRNGDLGTIRFERHLLCTDDVTDDPDPIDEGDED